MEDRGRLYGTGGIAGWEAVLAGRPDSKVIVLNVSDGKVQKEIDQERRFPDSGSRRGKKICDARGPTAKLWETDKWAMTAQLQGNPTAAESVARAEQALAFVKAEVVHHNPTLRAKRRNSKRIRMLRKRQRRHWPSTRKP
ncbi:MAG: hypothetical protein CM1200mP29_05680 [Verrucomicrobiota bacterium]|nr:MAG: hypothetical protein CM1200mP29_05680 [Verrucomicrobiota bacterium]